MMPQVCAAMIGTVAFSLLFGVPRKYYPWCGVIGARDGPYMCWLPAGGGLYALPLRPR